MYVRRVRAGEFIVVNPHLLADLVDKGLWTKEVPSMSVSSSTSDFSVNEDTAKRSKY